MSTKRGAVAESMFCTWALSVGYDVCFPARGLCPPYDLILHKDGAYTRVQVKRAHYRTRSNVREVRVKLTDRYDQPYKASDVDAFAVVDVEDGRMWLIPIEHTTTNMAFTTGKHDKWVVQER